MKKFALFSLVCASLFGATTPSYLPQNAPGCVEDETPSTVTVRHREHEGVGYKTGYTTLDFLFTPNWVRNFQPLLNVRGHVMNDGKFAANIGIGARGAPIEKLAIGGNFFFDYREVSNLPSYQLGSGIEILSPYVDFRVNGYLPVGHKTKTYPASFSRFSGNNILLRERFKAELATIYGELGASVPYMPENFQLYVAAGPYYIGHRHVELVNRQKIKVGDKWGGKYRLAARIYDYFDAGVELTHDPLFHTNVQGYLGVTLPLGPSKMYRGFKNGKNGNCSEARRFRRMMTQPVIRNEIIPIIEQTKSNLLATNAQGVVYDCIFVNLSAAPGGDGTFENPFQTLAEAEAGSVPNDCIIVFNGGGTYVNDGITLQQGQFLVGAASSFVANGVTIGPFDALVPQLIYSGNVLDVPIITLAENVLVKGLYLDNQNTLNTDTVIDIADAANFTIEENEIIGGGDYGISKVGVSSINPIAAGTKIIRNNTFTNNGKSAPTGKNGTIYLIFLDSSTVEITGNTFTIPASTAISNRNAFLMISTNNAVNTINFSGNTIHGVGDFATTVQDASNIAFDQPGTTNSTGSLTATIANNISDAANNVGIFINGTSVENTFNINGNTFSNLNDNAGALTPPLGVTLDPVNTNDSRYIINMATNTFTKLPAATADPGVNFDNANHTGDQVCLTMTGTTANFAAHANEGTHPASQFLIKSDPAGTVGYANANPGIPGGNFTYTGSFQFQDTTFPCPALP